MIPHECRDNKDTNELLKLLDIVAATNIVVQSWRETCTIIQNCFCKAGFKYHQVDPATQPEEPLVASAQDLWTENLLEEK